MQLKDFQQNLLDGPLDIYLDELNHQKEVADKIRRANEEETDPDLLREVPDFSEKAWLKVKEKGLLPKFRSNIPYSPRIDGIERTVPSACLKVPTGGGKTLIAAHAVSRIMSKWVRKNTGFVLWVMPNEAIYSQTKRAFTNREHPYRQILDKAGAGRVKILEKNAPLNKRDIESHLCIMLLMLPSANRKTKESLRIFRDRGNVHGFFPDGDDFLAHHEVLKQVPNLDVYGEKEMLGAIVKDSLGNAVKHLQPVVVLDEGHKGYSKLALKTLYGFNPSFVLELSATPKDRPKETPPIYSNWLVDICGKDLDNESMIKLPINVTVRGGDDWRDCLRESYEHLNRLQEDADRLRAETSRYIRPICLVQVERTGADQRDGNFIHADDAREYLLSLGVGENEIAIKTSEKNELKEPENLDLLSETNQVRFIITKQALQEGWDCPFAYVLCSLAPVTSRGAMTQLVGRILRQPDTEKTGIQSLDESYVFCYHTTTREVVEAIKAGLEQDGMADVADEIRETSDDGGDGGQQERELPQRDKYRDLKIYIPAVNWVEGDEVRLLDYEGDILFRLEWDDLNLEGLADKLVKLQPLQGGQTIRVDLTESADKKDFISVEDPHSVEINEMFDTVYAVRSIADILPNPWFARSIIGDLVSELNKKGLDAYQIGARSSQIIEALRSHLRNERDRLAEELFMRDVEAGLIQFRLRTDMNNWKLPEKMFTMRDPNSQQMYRDDGVLTDNSLFEPVYREDLNEYERSVAGYLDGYKALKWWHRNVARRQYAIQGWRKNKVYPDFIFSVSEDDENEKLFILETKGDQLAGNLDTEYKRKLLDTCTDSFEFEKVSKKGELELVGKDGTSVVCSMVFEENWQTELAEVLSK